MSKLELHRAPEKTREIPRGPGQNRHPFKYKSTGKRTSKKKLTPDNKIAIKTKLTAEAMIVCTYGRRINKGRLSLSHYISKTNVTPRPSTILQGENKKSQKCQWHRQRRMKASSCLKRLFCIVIQNTIRSQVWWYTRIWIIFGHFLLFSNCLRMYSSK